MEIQPGMFYVLKNQHILESVPECDVVLDVVTLCMLC
uniref:Uncharacterized protein n=2 Tax=Anguilla anguilla TaxID=7936 RepID=A0A0E9VVH6_ANGAN